MAVKEKEISSSRLYRSSANKIIAGVAGGLGEFFNIDPTIIRILFILLTIFGGSGLLIYIILWIVIPPDHQTSDISKETLKQNAQEIKSFAHDISHRYRREDSRFWWALFIIIIGFFFLFNNLGIFEFEEIGKFWPVLLVLLGISILLRH